MKRLLACLLLSIPAFAQIVRIDPTPVYTTSTSPPPGAYAPVLAVPGASISINTTTYTDATGSTPCPANAQVVIAGTSACTNVSSPQGSFGFWVESSATPYQYTITLPTGQVLGPFPVSAGGAGGSGGLGIYNALLVSQTIATPQTGGYAHWTPLTYNPYNQANVCKDSFGNPVQQPTLLPGDSIGMNDVVMWVATSGSLPATPTSNCPTPGGAPFPNSPTQTVDGVPNQSYGLYINSYFFAIGGLATSDGEYNSIQSLNGGLAVALGVTMARPTISRRFPVARC